jgi:hypothetical protein
MEIFIFINKSDEIEKKSILKNPFLKFPQNTLCFQVKKWKFPFLLIKVMKSRKNQF